MLKILLLTIALLPFSVNANSGKLVNLRCEYIENPIGIDDEHPRLSWNFPDGAWEMASGTVIIVGVDSLAVLAGKGDKWDYKVAGSRYQQMRYNGDELEPYTRYFWKVSNTTAAGKNYSSDVASFETGHMKAGRWIGSWIADNIDINQKPAANYRRTVHVSKKIRSARAYIAVGGLYELYINGHRIGSQWLDPVYTRYDKRNIYVTHDITSYLQQAGNVVGVTLGNGWYNHQSTAVWYFDKAPWRNRPAFCMDMRIEYEDGTVEVIGTDKKWKTALSEIVFNSIYTAEHVDGRLAQPGWNSNPSFDDSKWKNIMYRTPPSSNIVAQPMHSIGIGKTLEAASFTKINDSVYLYDFGQNISGISELTVSGDVGTEFRLIHTEQLDSNSRADMSNIIVHYRPKDKTDPFQTDIYTLGGTGTEVFSPKFNYKGFRYVEVHVSKPVTLKAGSLKAFFMHSLVPPAGTIKTSNEVVNKIWTATNNAFLSNFFGYPTDCPQREKNGWTGDAHINIETALYNFDAVTVYEKWMKDHQDEQQPNGVLPSIIPSNGWGYEWGNGPDWTSTIAIIPWNIYLFYGDATILASCYDNIKRYVDYITRISPSGLTTWGLGDWVPVKSTSPVEFTSTAYYYADVMILAKAAHILGKQKDYTHYKMLAETIKTKFNNKYLQPTTGLYGDGNQTQLSMALYWKMVPDSLIGKTAARLAERVIKDGAHIDVGLLGSKAILNALSENGYADLAYKLAANTTYPSWGWWIVNGATTLYENWNINASADLSRNHIMFGEIGAWLYKGIGGIYPDEDAPGFSNVLLKPNFVEGLPSYHASYKSVAGEIVSAWEKNKKGVEWKAVIPANATATVYLPSGYKKVLLNGKELATTTMVLLPGEYMFNFYR